MHQNIRKVLLIVFGILFASRIFDIAAESIRLKTARQSVATFEILHPGPRDDQARQIHRFLTNESRSAARKIPKHATEMLSLAAVLLYIFFRKEIEASEDEPSSP